MEKIFKKDGRRSGDDEEGENRKKEKKNTHTQAENKTVQLVHLCHWKSPRVFVRVRVNKTAFEVVLQHCTVASLRPLLSPCKNALGGYRKCCRIQS